MLTTQPVVGSWRPRTVDGAVAAFASVSVRRCGPMPASRAKNLLWACSKLGDFAQSRGLELEEEVLFSEAVIERFVALGCRSLSGATRRTLRTNLRFVARHQGWPSPLSASLPRERAKAPYEPAEMAGFLALADAQPTPGRRARANGIVCLGAGAGLMGLDLRAVRGSDIVSRSGGVVVVVAGRCPRVVPVLADYGERVLSAASVAGEGFVVGGVEPFRRNITSRLIASLSGGGDLPRLELPRLRATWLSTVAELIGLPTFMKAAGVTCSQRLGDVVRGLRLLDEAEAVALLGGRS